METGTHEACLDARCEQGDQGQGEGGAWREESLGAEGTEQTLVRAFLTAVEGRLIGDACDDGGREGRGREGDGDTGCGRVLERLSLDEMGRVAMSLCALRTRGFGGGHDGAAAAGGVAAGQVERAGGDDSLCDEDEGDCEMGWRGRVRERGMYAAAASPFCLARVLQRSMGAYVCARMFMCWHQLLSTTKVALLKHRRCPALSRVLAVLGAD